ncbi:hypothetical protein [Aureispira anguillae]|uniref:Uncharacterized protein n=1 Tax=Aureispira anguillae TaxID=2864201 RepID=A0A915YGH4_9BACT|nr:hypothetical protein [Aureispira anguillae]BDS12722.1 hypothetical protein AsAng_0034470 [Aureispira anguillae]
MKEFIDNGKLLSNFYNYRIVGCPNCSKPIDFNDLKLICTHCGYNKKFKLMDPCSGLNSITVEVENFLKIACCGNILWAINLEHLTFLERYVEADLRTRTPNINRSLVSRLPQWIKDRKNRKEVLKCIVKLRKSLVDNNYESK